MSKVALSYRQTPRERYHSSMNNEVADLIEAYPGIRMIDASGGSMMIADSDQLAADQSFTVKGSQGTIRGLALAIERQIERPVEIAVL